ncbi:L-histidine N(alpha)-methyltransferase [Litoreibacter roseus]|uniref:Dimethylhistidine N-methyltransferase n=1 Tax=Litoreibacter roseus TaxID=2601869 RepID=A0A6N6JKC4_9RHOB|nr:L-histidine N(alpha)-methyltransferase [Litoreibacter roseus]GFE65652.1 dimethylhistidine N-methyltransferase [Litoreibacter roseus]
MNKPLTENTEFITSSLNGLQSDPKTLQSKWFYDPAGSALFEEITQLPEYYPTRTELSILEAEADALAGFLRDGAALVELGSGASVKTRLLLDAAPQLGHYVPLDISAQFLKQSAADLARDYPALEVQPIVADFMRDVVFPPALENASKVAFFPGSTLGNLDQGQAVELLAKVGAWPGIDSFILGLDLVKDTEVLINAYNDSAGVTAAFNLNLLRRLNREAGATFDLVNFAHDARWNESAQRIEMHLVSKRAHDVTIGEATISFQEGESIHTENSHKYTADSIRDIAKTAGWQVTEMLLDPKEFFAVSVLKRAI